MADEPAPRRDEFHIAIICALGIEAKAVEAQFSTTWSTRAMGKHPDDRNTYTCGRIGEHLVVLVWMSGIGKTKATSATAHLRFSFKQIKHILVVGICGGVPRVGDEEILLGDVIIGMHLQKYDEGKQYPTGYQAGGKCTPNRELRAFLSKLKDSDASQRELKQLCALHLGDMAARAGFANAQYPGPGEDALYEASHLHKHYDESQCRICATAAVCDAAKDIDCAVLKCGKAHLVERERVKGMESAGTTITSPRIYFGAVGSGDTVMKSGDHRDRVARQEKIIAFEMEGAGVYEEMPSVVVIKGVCDYADSHKNKRWQPYAAMTAAACARAFLKMKENETSPTSSSRAQRGAQYIEEQFHGAFQHHADPARQSSSGHSTPRGLGLLPTSSVSSRDSRDSDRSPAGERDRTSRRSTNNAGGKDDATPWLSPIDRTNDFPPSPQSMNAVAVEPTSGQPNALPASAAQVPSHASNRAHAPDDAPPSYTQYPRHTSGRSYPYPYPSPFDPYSCPTPPAPLNSSYPPHYPYSYHAYNPLSQPPPPPHSYPAYHQHPFPAPWASPPMHPQLPGALPGQPPPPGGYLQHAMPLTPPDSDAFFGPKAHPATAEKKKEKRPQNPAPTADKPRGKPRPAGAVDDDGSASGGGGGGGGLHIHHGVGGQWAVAQEMQIGAGASLFAARRKQRRKRDSRRRGEDMESSEESEG